MAIIQRRNFLIGAAASLLAAPAIVHYSNIMPVKAIKKPFVIVDTYPYDHIPELDELPVRLIGGLEHKVGGTTYFAPDAAGKFVEIESHELYEMGWKPESRSYGLHKPKRLGGYSAVSFG